MSFRLAAIPSATACRGRWLNSIQSRNRAPSLACTSSTSFSTSATALGRGERASRIHGTEGLPIQKIRKKAKKGVFTDATTTGATTGAAEEAGAFSRTSSYTQQTIDANVASSVLPLKRTKDGSSRCSKEQGHTRQSQSQSQSQSSQSQSQPGKSSRLSYEDFLPPNHHRQRYLQRQRLIHMWRQQMHPQRDQGRSHHEGPRGNTGANHGGDHGGSHRGGHGGGHRGGHGGGHEGGHGGRKGYSHGRYNSWENLRNQPWWNPWMWHHLHESRKTAAKSFMYGIIVTGAGVGMYDASVSHIQQWHNFITDLTQIKNAFLDFTESSLIALPQSLSQSSGGLTSAIGGAAILGRSIPGLPSQGLHGSQKNLKMLTPEQVELRLGQHQKSFRIVDHGKRTQKNKRGSKSTGRPQQDVVLGYCVNQLPSNSPIEDDLSRHVVRGHDGEIERIFFGVYDGHSGWCCSQKVAKELAPSVARELDLIRNPRDTKAVVKAIERGFLNLDQRIVHDAAKRVLEHPSRPLACSSLLPAISGSCALMAYVDPRERDLYVACTGDSRAVMGVRELLPNGGHVWRAVPLSFDQTGRNRWEVKRLQQEHPGEEATVVMRGRVLGGLEPTRAFGDARYKWSKETQEKIFQLFPAYRQPYNNFNTPPYVTAKPVVRHHKLRPEDRFLVMATDGLWDKLTSDEVVQLVGDLLDGKIGHAEMVLDREAIQKYRQGNILPLQEATSSAQGFLQEQRQEEEDMTPLNMTAKGPASQVRKFTYRDQANASTHLIRNALGGADDDKIAATLSIPSPMSRVYRDDITVTVVFFGQQETMLALSDAQDTDGLADIH